MLTPTPTPTTPNFNCNSPPFLIKIKRRAKKQDGRHSTRKRTMSIDSQTQKTHIYIPDFIGILEKKNLVEKKYVATIFIIGIYRNFYCKAENLIISSPYSWVTSRKKLERSNNYFSSNSANKNFFDLSP